MIGRLVRAARYRLAQARLPRVVTLTDFDAGGLRFAVSNPVERYRVVGHGGETEYLGAMLAALRADDVLYDVGANVGLVALHAARRCRTVAFEPDPSFRARLHGNLRLNPDLRLTVVPVAVSDTNGEVTLYTDGAGGNSPSLVHQRGEKGAVQVAACTLDSLIEAGELPHPTLLKVDIEGAEILALRGAAGLLGGPSPPRALFLEVHDSFLPAFSAKPEDVLDLVREAGYTEVRYWQRRGDQQHLILER